MPIETVDLVSSQAVTEREAVDSLAEIFWENTKLRPRAGIEASARRIQWFFSDPRKVQTSRQSYKTYATVPWLPLPEPAREGGPSFDAVMHARRSAVLSGTGPVFSEEAVPLQSLSDLLYYTYGVARERPVPEAVAPAPAPAAGAHEPGPDASSGEREASPDLVRDQKERTVAASAQAVVPELRRRLAPSGGALYPLELYVVALNVEGLRPGVYHYNAYGHHLEQLRTEDGAAAAETLDRMVTVGLNYEGVAFALVISVIPLRSVFKYGDRGYRLLLVECGHAAQNTYLAAAARGISLCAIAGFYDDEVNRVLGINGLDEFSAYVFLAGMPLPEGVGG